MADGELTLKLDEETARRLQEAADAAGRPVADYAADLIVDGLGDWAEDVRIAEAHDSDGASFSLQEGLAAFDAAVQQRFGAPR